MKMFSNCSGECKTCYIHYVGGCLAGHGDDDYIEITLEKAREALDNGYVKSYLIDKLYKMFPELNNDMQMLKKQMYNGGNKE